MAAFVSPQSFWVLSLFGLAYPILLVFNIIFFFIFVSLKSRTAILSLACILLGWNYLSVMYANNSSEAVLTETNIKICSFNIQTMKLYYAAQPKKKEHMSAKYFKPYKDFFEQAGANIYCIQENRTGHRYFEKFMSELLPYRAKGRQAIYSKYPIINQGKVIETKSTNGVVFADIKIDTAIIRVYNVHLQSTGVGPEAQKLVTEKDLENESRKSGLKNIYHGLRSAGKTRAEQVDKLVNHIKHSPYRVIVCGDFNDTPYSYSYQQIKGNLKDSFIEKGNGFGVTYNGPIPTLRIDYILGSSSLNFLSHKIIKSEVSDHYPIISEISY